MCALLAHFGARGVRDGGAAARAARAHAPRADPLDLALIGCARPVPVAPTRLSAVPYAPHTRAVLLGHSGGDHVNTGETINVTTAYGASRVYVPHVRFTRLAASFQTPQHTDDAGGVAAFATRGFIEDDGSFSPLPFEAAAASSKGFVDLSPALGMSGGAVVDTRCGVFGITERKSVFAQGGQFVRLTPAVVLRVAADRVSAE